MTTNNEISAQVINDCIAHVAAIAGIMHDSAVGPDTLLRRWHSGAMKSSLLLRQSSRQALSGTTMVTRMPNGLSSLRLVRDCLGG